MLPAAPDPELIGVFKDEARDWLDVIHDHLLHIEQGAADAGARLEEVLRLVHDLKGSARVVGYELTAHLAHGLEAHLLPWRRLAPQPGQIDVALRTTDTLRELVLDADDAGRQSRARALLSELQATSLTPAPPGPPAPPAASASPAPVAPAAPSPSVMPVRASAPVAAETLRVPRSHVDRVADDVAVLLHDTQSAQVRVQELKTALDAVRAVRLPRAGAPSREITRTFGILRALQAELVTACHRSQDTLNQFDLHTRKLDDDTRRLCLVPAKPLLQHLDSAARDAGRSLGRSLRVDIDGRDELVDEALIEALKGPLTHAVRNAVDHGLETADERAAAGKPPAGTLRLAIEQGGDRLRVTIADDGRGIDRAAVRRKLGESASGLDDQGLLQALLRSGVSTRDTVTEISGRGLGLGALALVADRLRGEVEINSPPGAGTTLRLSVPLRLSTLEGLVVEAGGSRFVLPASAVAGVAGVAAPGVRTLASVIGLPDAPGQPLQALRLHARGAEVVLGIERLDDSREVVRRPTGSHLGRVPFVDGATILPHGEPALILDVHELLEACAVLDAPPPPARAAAPRGRILLVDDSATVRAQMLAVLSQAGFEVVLAEDGQAALERLQAVACDALVSDVQMPRLDGLQLLERCAGRLPVVLMTSQPEPRGRARARELGAAGYLAKDGELGAAVLAILQQTLTRSKDTRP